MVSCHAPLFFSVLDFIWYCSLTCSFLDDWEFPSMLLCTKFAILFFPPRTLQGGTPPSVTLFRSRGCTRWQPLIPPEASLWARPPCVTLAPAWPPISRRWVVLRAGRRGAPTRSQNCRQSEILHCWPAQCCCRWPAHVAATNQNPTRPKILSKVMPKGGPKWAAKQRAL